SAEQESSRNARQPGPQSNTARQAGGFPPNQALAMTATRIGTGRDTGRDAEQQWRNKCRDHRMQSDSAAPEQGASCPFRPRGILRRLLVHDKPRMFCFFGRKSEKRSWRTNRGYTRAKVVTLQAPIHEP